MSLMDLDQMFATLVSISQFSCKVVQLEIEADVYEPGVVNYFQTNTQKTTATDF